jgi:hypothetical protein
LLLDPFPESSMPSYYEALPIYKVAMDVAVRVDAVVQRFAKGHKHTLGSRLRETTLDVEEPKPCGNVKRRRLAYLFERPLDNEAQQEESR